jgi:CelD/BcsL family acetyltransferase involved in cellulose biosynthesis
MLAPPEPDTPPVEGTPLEPEPALGTLPPLPPLVAPPAALPPAATADVEGEGEHAARLAAHTSSATGAHRSLVKRRRTNARRTSRRGGPKSGIMPRF